MRSVVSIGSMLTQVEAVHVVAALAVLSNDVADESLVAEGMLDAAQGDVAGVEEVDDDAGGDVGDHANMGNGVDDADDRGSSVYADSVNGGDDDGNHDDDAEHGADAASGAGVGGEGQVARADTHADGVAAARRKLAAASSLSLAWEIFGLTCGVSSKNMSKLYKVLWAEIPDACTASACGAPANRGLL